MVLLEDGQQARVRDGQKVTRRLRRSWRVKAVFSPREHPQAGSPHGGIESSKPEPVDPPTDRRSQLLSDKKNVVLCAPPARRRLSLARIDLAQAFARTPTPASLYLDKQDNLWPGLRQLMWRNGARMVD